MSLKIPEYIRGNTFKQDTHPTVAQDGDSWFDTFHDEGGTYIYDSSRGGWRSVANGLGYAFLCGDTTQAIGEQITFSSDDAQSAHTAQSTARDRTIGFNSTVRGYMSGGYISPNASAVIDKFEFYATNATMVHIANLSLATSWGTPANSSTHGYNMGGLDVNVSTNSVSTVQRVTFAADASPTTSSGNLNSLYTYIGNGVNSSLKGYSLAGIYNTTLTNQIASQQAYVYEYASDASSNYQIITTNSYGLTSCNSSTNWFALGGAGFTGGPPGTTTSRYSTCRTGQFATTGLATVFASLHGPNVRLVGCGFNSSSKGYRAGGIHTLGNFVTDVQRMDFALQNGTQVLNTALSHDYYENGCVDTTDFINMFV